MRRRSPGWIFKRTGRRGTTYYVAYVVDGRKIREAAGPRKTDATALLARRTRELDDGKWTHPAAPLTFDDLLGLVKADWRARGRKSRLTTTSGMEQAGVRYLRDAFGRADASAITAARLASYANDRLDAGAQPSTVRNELNVIKRAMHLAHRTGQLPVVPAFPTLTPTNVRTGFFERHELDAMLTELPEPVRAVVTFMYLTGWRRGEVLSRRWSHVDTTAGVIRLDPGETKNGRGRDFPYALLPELAAVIEGQRRYTDAVQRRTGQVVPWLFHREGHPVKSFRTAWRAACKRIALRVEADRRGVTPRDLWRQMTREERAQLRGSGHIPHDFRRTAVRNLVRAGVSEKVAMELSGHLTRSVFERYNITTDRDRRDAVARLAAATPDKQVLTIRAKRAARA